MTEKTSYRVRAGCPLVQIMSAHPTPARKGPGLREITQRHFRAGDLLPDWVPAAEVARLVGLGFVEVAS